MKKSLFACLVFSLVATSAMARTVTDNDRPTDPPSFDTNPPIIVVDDPEDPPVPTEPTSIITSELKITPPTTPPYFQYFGCNAALSGNTAIVGSYYINDPVGGADLFDVNTGNHLRKLTPAGSYQGEHFGSAVDISGNIALVGTGTEVGHKGAAYLFDVTTGQQLHRFAPTIATPTSYGKCFGRVVAVEGNTALVSDFESGGRVYQYDVTTGQHIRTLVADSIFAGSFGSSIAISNNIAIIGDSSGNRNACYVFDLTTGEQLRKLQAQDSNQTSGFGGAVAIDGNYAIIGNRYETVDGVQYAGAVFVFDITTGEQIAKIVSDDPEKNAEFATELALQGNIAVLGARLKDGSTAQTTQAGEVYLYDITTGDLIEKFCASDAGYGHNFGASVDMDGDKLLVSAWRDNSAYVYTVTPEPATMSMLAIGGLALLRRSRNKRK